MPEPSRFRMYVDESGDHVMDAWPNLESRYLGLTGVVISNSQYREHTDRDLYSLKQEFFPHNPDDPVILVRNQIVRKDGPFFRLQDAQYALRWEESIIAFMQKHIRRIFTVVIDKQAHRDRYGSAARHPYHYGFTVLTERYRGWLKVVGARGDIMAESRSGTPDKQLKRVFRGFMEEGTDYLSAQELQNYITSKEIKLKPKSANISGLQLADLIAYPAKIEILQANNRQLSYTPSPATRRIIEGIQSRYNSLGKKFLE